MLHPIKQTNANPSATENEPASSNKPSREVDNTEVVASCSLVNPVNAVKAAEGIYLRVVPVIVTYGNKSVKTYAFLDQGSTRSFCDKRLVDILGASGPTDEIVLQTLTGAKSYQGITFSLSVSCLEGGETFSLSNVVSIPEIPVSPNPVPAKGDLNRFAHLKGIPFSSIPRATVTLLIGADSPELFCVREVRKGMRGQPIAINTPLGWSLLGPSLSLSKTKNCHVNFVKADSSLQRDINCLWESDFGCGTSILDVPSSKEDRIMFDLLQNSVSMIDGHYQLPLPWRPNTLPPGDSLPIAKQRRISLQKRLKRDETLRQKYTEVIETYIMKNYARQVPKEELDNSSTIWCLIFLCTIQEKVKYVSFSIVLPSIKEFL